MSAPQSVNDAVKAAMDSLYGTPELTFFESIALPLVARVGRVAPLFPKTKKVHTKLVPSPLEMQSDDPAKIHEWGLSESNANVGVYAEQIPGGLWFLDKDGAVSLVQKYESETGKKFPDTLLVRSSVVTIDGKRVTKGHWYFRHTAKTLAIVGNITEGQTGGLFGMRLHNEYVCSIGSIHPDTGLPYEIVKDGVITEAPDEFVDWLLSHVKYNKTGDFTKKPEGWINEPIVHGDINNRLTAIAGFYIQNKNINNADALADILIGHAERQAVCEDGVTPYSCNLDEIRTIAQGCVARYKTGEEKAAERTVTFNGVPAGQVPVSEPVGEPVGWHEPQSVKDLLSPVEPFQLDFLPTSIRPWVQDVSVRMSVPVDFVGICALVTLAGVTCRRAFVYPKQHDKEWREALAVSGAVVASSGMTKTPVWKVFTSFLNEIEDEWKKEHGQKVANFLQKEKAYAASQSLFKKAGKKTKTGQGDFTVEIEDSVTVPSEPQEPEPCRRLMTNDSTPEKLQDLMRENPEGLFVYRDELSSWAAELDKKDRESARGLYLAAMNGDDPYTMDRIERGSVSAIMSCSLFGGIQPDLFIDFLSNSRNITDGTLPRFGLIIWPDQQILPLKDQLPDTVAKQQFRAIVRILANLPAKSIGLHFSPDAQVEFNLWLEKHSQKIHAEDNPGKKSHLSKYKGLLPKLAGLLQLVDIVMATPSAVGTHMIDSAHLGQAIRLLACLETHMHRVYSSARTPEQKAIKILAGHLLNGDLEDGFTVRDITNRKEWAGLKDRRVVDSALETLEELGWVQLYPNAKKKSGGRPTSRWSINPKLTEK